jgi:DMSO/TMAO reductase YedYZ molybdopterin-dependent catalytic subunit
MPLEALRYDITPVGLHYLLIHYDIPAIAAQDWRLQIGGLVGRPLTLSLADIRARPQVTLPVTMECAGNGRARMSPIAASQPWLVEAVGTAEWTGTPLRPLLEAASVAGGGVDVVFTGADRGVEGGIEQNYERALPVDAALRDEVLLAYEINGQPLSPQHGFPLRLVVPGWYGMTSVKWLTRITVVGEPFRGYQMVNAYRWKDADDDPGRPVTRMVPRALMMPPGIPSFFERDRFVPMGPVPLGGRAWSGWAPVQRVDVSTDGGRTWEHADLGAPVGAYAWVPWQYTWHPRRPGAYELCCRASDAGGRVQPVEPVWNVGGYANNAVQRVRVTVT